MMAKPQQLHSKSRLLDLSRPQVMGILNVTPDSFSDGGQFNQIDKALRHAEDMINAGATIIDIGGESTRPGASEVSLQDELMRVIPIVKLIRSHFDVWISLDTSKAEVMKQGVESGADIINDIRSLSEPNALETAALLNVPVCIMHMQGSPQTMQNKPKYSNVIEEVSDYLMNRIEQLVDGGVTRENIIIDPGFGFGKSLEHNYQLLANFEHFNKFELPILSGMSRKSMVHNLLNKKPADCMIGSVIGASVAASKGAHIIRVHDVQETVDALKVTQAIQDNQHF